MNQNTSTESFFSQARYYAFRLSPGEDMVQSVREFVNRHGLLAVAVVTCVGSLRQARLRFANAETWIEKSGPFEILSLVGTIDQEGEHLHITLADGEGQCIGGHFGSGSSVYTTAEIVLVELTDFAFKRSPCPLSGYDELAVQTRAACRREQEE